jgi:hypothetical protein
MRQLGPGHWAWARVAVVATAVVIAAHGLVHLMGAAFQARAGISGAFWAAPPYIELALTSLAACWLLLHTQQTRARESRPPRKEADHES